MNICLLNDSFPPVIDGVANVVMNYAKIMTNNLGAQVIVGTPKYPNASYEGYPYKVIPYKSLDTTKLVAGYRAGNPLAMREIGQMAEFGPDIIHTHCPVSSTIMARILQNETGAPIVFTYHTKFDVDIARAVGEGFLKKETIKAMVNNIEACDEVWVVSEGAGENLRSLGYEGDYRVVSNGVDFPKGRIDDQTVKDVTSGFDLPEDIPVFLFVGRIMKYKGLPLIIDALKKLTDNGIDYRMVFVGGGADAEELKQTVIEYGINLDARDESGKITHTEGKSGSTGKIIFTGAEHDRLKLRAWNTRADLFLFPSVYDTNGIVVREAAACGLGSVLIKGSCAAEGITHGGNGYLIEENAESMAELLSALSSRKDEMNQVGQHAMDEIYISWEDSVRDAYARYGEIKEKFRDGSITTKKMQSTDYFLKSASALIKGTDKVFDFSRNIYDGMIGNYNEFVDNIEYFTDHFSDELKDNLDDFKDNFKDNVEEFKENFKENVQDFKSEFQENLEEFKDNFEELKSDMKEKFPHTHHQNTSED